MIWRRIQPTNGPREWLQTMNKDFLSVRKKELIEKRKNFGVTARLWSVTGLMISRFADIKKLVRFAS